MSQLWMLVGGNGAGKTTFFELFLEPRGLPFVNADRIAREFFPEDPEGHSYEAARMADILRQDLLVSGTSFCFETVFSHPSKVDFVARAKALGYEIVLVFIHLSLPELNLVRVGQRSIEGGHSVPPGKVLSRIPRVLNNVRRVLPLCDEVRVLDNSSVEDPFVPVLTIRNGELVQSKMPLPEWAESLIS